MPPQSSFPPSVTPAQLGKGEQEGIFECVPSPPRATSSLPLVSFTSVSHLLDLNGLNLTADQQEVNEKQRRHLHMSSRSPAPVGITDLWGLGEICKKN